MARAGCLRCLPFLSLLSAVSIVLAVSGCGCGRRETGRGTVAQLRQVRVMTAPDGANRTCYVFAEIENSGQWPVRKAKVTATLTSAGGKPRGLNHYLLSDVKPGEHRIISMTVEAQGSFRDVQLSFHDPDEK